MTKTFHGLAGAPGIGIGSVIVYRPDLSTPEIEQAPFPIDPDQEWQKFLEAHAKADAELEQLSDNPNSLIAELFAAHRVILQDKTLLESVRTAIYESKATAALATHQVITELADLFMSFEDEYFSGRSTDVTDLGHRLLIHLGAALGHPHLDQLPPRTILVAEDLPPSNLTQFPTDRVVGIALARSTPTAHSAILARSLGIPMVCALDTDILHLLPGQQAIVDGNQGQVLTSLSDEESFRYREIQHALFEQQALAVQHAKTSAITRDGRMVPVCANANSPQEVALSRDVGADGIGLLRTEYLFRGRATPPTFSEQEQTYARFITQVSGQLTVRALDAGGDKPVDYISHHREENPFLGLRGVRLLIDQPEILRTQYRALQAAAHRTVSNVEVRYMLPMISTFEEIDAVHKILAELPNDLPPLKIGIMIEVPSAALIPRTLSPLVDFFSIGTNDLAQYVLATDRTNSTVARVADPLHPSVLQLIQITCDAAREVGKPVSLCGEIAGDTTAVPLLLGLGVTELSAPLPAVPLVKEAVRQCDTDQCRRLALLAIRCRTAPCVRALLVDRASD